MKALSIIRNPISYLFCLLALTACGGSSGNSGGGGTATTSAPSAPSTPTTQLRTRDPFFALMVVLMTIPREPNSM